MSGGFNIESIVASAALAAVTGGAGLAIEAAAMSIMSSVAKQVIQQVGQQLGLPPAAISAATAAFDAASGNTGAVGSDVASTVQNVASQLNASPTETGQLQSQADNAVSGILDAVIQGTGGADSSSGTNGKDGFLVALAKALGKALDNKMTKMKDLSDQINQAGNSNQSKLGSLGGEIQAVGQEVNILSTALQNTLKSVGDAESTLARKS